MVQNILDNHSEIFGGPEFDWLPEFSRLQESVSNSIRSGRLDVFCTEQQFRELYQKFLIDLFGLSLQRTGKKIFSEKTPDNVLAFREIKNLFPAAKFIFVLIRRSIQAGSNFLKDNPASCHLLFYEDLIAEPEPELRKLCSFLGVELEESMLQNRPSTAVTVAAAAHESASAFGTESMLKGGVDKKRMEAWKTELSALEKLRSKLYFKRHKMAILERYGL